MKIPLPNGNCIYVGKNVFHKSASIVRNQQGEIVNVSRSSSLENIDRYLDCFAPCSYLRNFIFLYENVAEIYFPIHYITSRIKNANFVVKRWADDSVIWADCVSDPLDTLVAQRMKQFLARPNCLQSFKTFLEQAFIYRYLTGNSFIYASCSPAAKQNLWKYCNNFWVLPTQYIRIETQRNVSLFSAMKKEDLITAYNLTSPLGCRSYNPLLVLHSRDNFNLDMIDDYFMGKSRLLSLKYPISNLCAVYEARNVIYNKRGALGALVNMKRDADTYLTMTPDEKRELRNEFQERYGVSNRKDPLALIDVPVQYIQFGLSIQDLQPFEEALTDSATIAGIFNIDSVLIPRKDNATFNNLREAECKVYSSTIIPDVKAFMDELNDFLGLNEAGYYIEALWDDVEVLQESRAKKEAANKSVSDRCKTEFEAGLITLNEWRVAVGKERIGSKLYDKTKLEMTDAESNKMQTKLM